MTLYEVDFPRSPSPTLLLIKTELSPLALVLVLRRKPSGPAQRKAVLPRLRHGERLLRTLRNVKAG